MDHEGGGGGTGGAPPLLAVPFPFMLSEVKDDSRPVRDEGGSGGLGGGEIGAEGEERRCCVAACAAIVSRSRLRDVTNSRTLR